MSDDGEDKQDLTRIEDLSEFLHQDDPETDRLLDENNDDNSPSEETPIGEDLSNLDDLEDGDNDGSFTEASFGSEDQEEEPPAFGEEEDSTDFSDEGDASPPAFGEEESETFGSDDSDNTFESNDEEADTFGDDAQDDPFGETGDDAFGEETETASFGDDSDQENNNFAVDNTENPFGEETEANFENSNDAQNDFQDNDEEEEEEENFQASTEDEQSFEEADSPEQEDTSSEEVEDISSEPGPTPEPFQATPPSPLQPASQPYQQEKFQDVKDFAKSMTYGNVGTGGNPPYSIIIKEAVYQEDADDILIILREHGLLNDDNEETMKQCLNGGSLLISQISEYSAIYLAHRMRRFNIEIMMGLSEELHPSKNYENEGKGLVSKQHIFQNKKESISLEDSPVELEDILISTTPSLENYSIQRYIGLANEHALITEEELQDFQVAALKTEEENKNDDSYTLGIHELYDNLAEKLKVHALKNQGNAIVGINYQLSPLVSENDSQAQIRYKVTCTGNIVWVVGDSEN